MFPTGAATEYLFFFPNGSMQRKNRCQNKARLIYWAKCQGTKIPSSAYIPSLYWATRSGLHPSLETGPLQNASPPTFPFSPFTLPVSLPGEDNDAFADAIPIGGSQSDESASRSYVGRRRHPLRSPRLSPLASRQSPPPFSPARSTLSVSPRVMSPPSFFPPLFPSQIYLFFPGAFSRSL